jgi:hypothetical protein
MENGLLRNPSQPSAATTQIKPDRQALNCVLFLELSGTTCMFLENILFFCVTDSVKTVAERRDWSDFHICN